MTTALMELAGAAPERITADLKAELAGLDAEWTEQVQRYDAGRHEIFPGRFEPVFLQRTIERLSWVQRERADRRGKLLSLGVESDATDPAREIWDALAATSRAAELRVWALGEWRRLIDHHLDGHAVCLRRVDEAKRRYAEGGPVAAVTMNENATRADQSFFDLIAERDRHAKALETLRHDPGQRARQAGEVFEDAGGAQLITSCARSALQFSERFEEASPDHSRAVSAEQGAADLDAALKRIDGKTPLAAVLKTRLSEAKATAKQAKAKAAEDAEARLARLIAEAQRGENPAVANLQSLAREVPIAFPEGFSDSLNRIGAPNEDQLAGALAVVVETHMTRRNAKEHEHG